MGEGRREGRGHFKQKMSFGKCLPSANCRYVFGFRGLGLPLLGTRVEEVQTAGMSYLRLSPVDLLAYLAEKSPSFQGLLVLKEGNEKKRGATCAHCQKLNLFSKCEIRRYSLFPFVPHALQMQGGC